MAERAATARYQRRVRPPQVGGLFHYSNFRISWPNFALAPIPIFMSEADSARFRKQAEECREQAAKAISPLDKEAWLRVAEEWLKLASSVESRRE
jgi:hypothetical protein